MSITLRNTLNETSSQCCYLVITYYKYMVEKYYIDFPSPLVSEWAS